MQQGRKRLCGVEGKPKAILKLAKAADQTGERTDDANARENAR